jgi:hypothetical protein
MSKKMRVTKMAATTDDTVPMSSVVAKFCTGPVPYCHKTKPAMNVVTFASMIAENALS